MTSYQKYIQFVRKIKESTSLVKGTNQPFIEMNRDADGDCFRCDITFHYEMFHHDKDFILSYLLKKDGYDLWDGKKHEYNNVVKAKEMKFVTTRDQRNNHCASVLSKNFDRCVEMATEVLQFYIDFINEQTSKNS